MDPLSLVVWSTIALGVLLFFIGAATVGISVRDYRRDVRIRERRPIMTEELFSRLSDERSDWDTWVTDLSSIEQAAVRSITEQLLRELRGAEHRDLGRLALALGIDQERLRHDVKSQDLYRTLRALSWLALLDYPAVTDEAINHCTWNQATRSALARVLYENDDPRAGTIGVDLLVEEGTEPLSVFGLDTLYCIVRRNPTYLLDCASTEHETWNDPVLAQVLITLQHCRSGINPASITWVADCLTGDSEIQTEALLLLGDYGWSSNIRDSVDITEFCLHPDPRVRQAAYTALSEWDTDGLSSFADMIAKDPDDLARLVGTRVLCSQGYAEIDNPPTQFTRTRRWVTAQSNLVHEPL